MHVKKLPLSAIHRSMGADFMEFNGWEMPLKYSSISEEHLAVRKAAGLFDISHMGELLVEGKDSLKFLQHMTSNDVSMLAPLTSQYSTVLNEQGGVKDDIFVYRLGDEKFMLVVNAGNVEKIYNWLVEHSKGEVEISDITNSTEMFSLQGPKSQQILQPLVDLELGKLGRFHAAFSAITGVNVLLSRTGYTGEDGFEIYVMNGDFHGAGKLWSELMREGAKHGMKPCGLGSRDTLRLEAGCPLYGHELTEDITPLEARIEFAVKFEKGDFIGRTPLLEQKRSGLKRVRVGFVMKEAGVPRPGYRLMKNGEEVGVVTSGTFSPILNIGIGMGYIRPDAAREDDLQIEIRNAIKRVKITAWPFHLHASIRNL